MFYNSTNEDIASYVTGLTKSPGFYISEVVAIHFTKNRAGTMIGELYQPMYGGIIITMQNGVRVPPPPSPNKILKISTWGEASNPQIEELEPVKKSNKRVVFYPYAPLKYFFKSRRCEEILFDDNETRELEEIYEYLSANKRIEISEEKMTLNEIMKKPHLKYCMLLLLNEFKSKLL